MTSKMILNYILQTLCIVTLSTFIFTSTPDQLELYAAPKNIGVLFQEKGIYVLVVVGLLSAIYMNRHIGLHPFQTQERWIFAISAIFLLVVTLPLILFTLPLGENMAVYLLFSINLSISIFFGIKHFGFAIL